jgi:hypothetical protein
MKAAEDVEALAEEDPSGGWFAYGKLRKKVGAPKAWLFGRKMIFFWKEFLLIRDLYSH